MRSKGLIFVLILSLAINVAVLATTGYHYYLSASAKTLVPCPISPGDSHLYQSLGLSNLQMSKMDPLAQKFHGQLAELGASMEEKKGLLMDLLQKEGDPVRVEELRKEMAALQDEIQKGVILHIAEIKKILDPRQQEQFFNLMRQSMTHGGSPWAPTNGGR
jgi:Spy/CpxP family protein refolding chaperone